MSLHLVRHPPGHVHRALGAMRRHWGGLTRTPGLATARVVGVAPMPTSTGGTPNPTQWGVLCGWHDPGARDEFLASGARGVAPLVDGNREAYTLSLDTVRVTNGSWAGWTPTTDAVGRLSRDEPLAVLTYGRLRVRYLWAFTRDNRRIVAELDPNPGHTWRIGLFDHLMARATFSLWRTQGDMVRFSYGPDSLHKRVQREAQTVPWGGEWFFARFRLAASSGSWQGRDPVAELRQLATATA